MIKAKEAHVLWDEKLTPEGHRVPTEHVLVTDQLQEPQDPGRAHRFLNSAGAHVSGWCRDDPRANPSAWPEGVFASTLFTSGGPAASSTVIEAWLREFSKIEECEWARRMLAALELRRPEA